MHLQNQHLLSEPGKWLTQSEFTDADGRISKASGETLISINGSELKNNSWIDLNGRKLSNDYTITQINERLYKYVSKNPALGLQKGTFNIDRNRIYSKFVIENTAFNGFEVIVRRGNCCYSEGALYDGDVLVNIWTCVMEKA
ncbi:hypothetical protein [Paludibacter jiangxiensis]|uniref:Uncharacterized protein n=1 Tax=Paludibacter jiangxiensis TaxID=681398 RepID=A0A171ATM1_9BACT|nr:hypothetical protein [Paludibacter jiangxiensis]GAT64249.1 hypothetical protein PJIAN_4799 [Paludibacter jiangxiensis]